MAYRVRYKGAMRDMFAQNDLRGNVDLQTWRNLPHLYALGPLEGLKGEIVVLNGTAHISRIVNGVVRVQSTWNAKAVFAVWAQVEKWNPVPMAKSLHETELDGFVLASATTAGLDVSKPVPFLLKGRIKNADWHIVNLQKPLPHHTREYHEKIKVKRHSTNTPVEILGFYGSEFAGIWTHHTAKTHMHIFGMQIAGHLEALETGTDMTLFLPR